MRALQLKSFGGPEVLHFTDVSVGAPGENEVLIDVYSAGLNFADTERRRGLYLADQPLPATLGLEGSGVVTALGAKVPEVWLGRRVAFLANGACADQCLAPVSKLIHLPDSLDFARGAAFPVQWLTAWHLVHTVAKLQRNERVVIQSAAGGVGQALVQLAREAGAQVTAVVSRDAKKDVVRALGCADVRLRGDALPVVDVVLEAVGAEVVTSTIAALTPFGRWVNYGTSSGPLPALDVDKLLFPKSLSFSSYWLRSEHPPGTWDTGVREVLARLVDGRARMLVTSAPLEDAAKWHRRLEGGLTTGKVVFQVRGTR
ncbi:MAG: zinc-binding dehydrogenase [Myxococcaceae bacterium]